MRSWPGKVIRSGNPTRLPIALLVASLVGPLALAQSGLTISPEAFRYEGFIGRAGAEAVVVIRDENGAAPVANAIVTFTLPPESPNSPSGFFGLSEKTLEVRTDANGKAVAKDIRSNTVRGTFLVRIRAARSADTPPATASVEYVNQLDIKSISLEAASGIAVSNICKHTSAVPKIAVHDDQGRSVYGATVTISLPKTGASGVFRGGELTRKFVTDKDGVATATGLVPNKTAGKFDAAVEVDLSPAIPRLPGAGPDGSVPIANVKQGCPIPVLPIVAVVAAGGAGAALAVSKGKGTTTNTVVTPPPTPTLTVTPGSPNFGGPH